MRHILQNVDFFIFSVILILVGSNNNSNCVTVHISCSMRGTELIFASFLFPYVDLLFMNTSVWSEERAGLHLGALLPGCSRRLRILNCGYPHVPYKTSNLLLLLSSDESSSLDDTFQSPDKLIPVAVSA